jgi:GGDEF domain-containing protein
MSEHSDPLEEILKRDDIPREAKSAIREACQKMEFLALHDQMTGLYNRAYYDNEIAKIERERE